MVSLNSPSLRCHYYVGNPVTWRRLCSVNAVELLVLQVEGARPVKGRVPLPTCDECLSLAKEL